MSQEQVTVMKDRVSRTFHSFGDHFSARQMEVLFFIITSTGAILSYVDWNREHNHHELTQEYLVAYSITMTILRFVAVLYTYKQFKIIYELGSNLILGFAILLVFLSSCIYVCYVLYFFNVNMADIRDSLFIFFLLNDLDKVSYLSHCALKSTTYAEVKANITEAVSHLGPSMTLDSGVLALLISVEIWAEDARLALMCQYGVLAIIVHFVSLLTLYPACISLHLEALTRSSSAEPQWLLKTAPHTSEANTLNPVIQGVKKIMSAGLVIVHGIKSFSDPVDVTDSLKMDNVPSIAKVMYSEAVYIAFVIVIIIMLLIYSYFRGTRTDLTTMDNLREGRQIIQTLGTPLDTTQPDCDGVQAESNGTLQLVNSPARTVEECLSIYGTQGSVEQLTNEECLLLLNEGHLRQWALEDVSRDCLRAVEIRREFYQSKLSNPDAMKDLPYLDYDYAKVRGRCCENTIGYCSLPAGIVGPLTIDGVTQFVTLCTTEGALCASVNRGCKALGHAVDGIRTAIHEDGMTRAPMIRLPSAMKAVEVKCWVKDNFDLLKQAFDSTSNYARLDTVRVAILGRLLYLRFVARTGDAMGMNMVTKGSQAALDLLQENFDEVEVLSISGNFCTDKKHSAVNWILGRGKSVVCEAIIPGKVVKSVLKTTSAKMVDLNFQKNFAGSAMAGSIGGNNCHAGNVVAAIFIATGQDVAQITESASCATMMECWGETNEDLWVSVTMPSLCVGTVGGGTGLDSQMACLRMLNIQGPSPNNDGEHSGKLASVIAATVMAGEISLLASQEAKTLVKSHMALNRRHSWRS